VWSVGCSGSVGSGGLNIVPGNLEMPLCGLGLGLSCEQKVVNEGVWLLSLWSGGLAGYGWGGCSRGCRGCREA
jgi:hypothetical protein